MTAAKPQHTLALSRDGAEHGPPRTTYRLTVPTISEFEGFRPHLLAQVAKKEKGQPRFKMPQVGYQPYSVADILLGKVNDQERENMLATATNMLIKPPFMLKQESEQFGPFRLIAGRHVYMLDLTGTPLNDQFDRMAVLVVYALLTRQVPHLTNDLQQFMEYQQFVLEAQSYRANMYNAIIHDIPHEQGEGDVTTLRPTRH